MTLEQFITNQIRIDGSLRAVAKRFDIDVGYLSRLHHGEKEHPSEALLKKLGLARVVTYRYRTPEDDEPPLNSTRR